MEEINEANKKIVDMLDSSDNEIVLLGITFGKFKEKWNNLFDEFLLWLNKHQSKSIWQAISDLEKEVEAKGGVILSNGTCSASELKTTNNDVARTYCMYQMLKPFFNTEVNILENQYQDDISNIFSHFKNV